MAQKAKKAAPKKAKKTTASKASSKTEDFRAKSGDERVNLIAYFDIDDKIYVVGSAAGRDASPGWVFNFRADPTVTVEIGADPPKQMVAHELPKAERDRVYDLIVERAPGFGEYQKKTDRVIPVFELAAS